MGLYGLEKPSKLDQKVPIDLRVRFLTGLFVQSPSTQLGLLTCLAWERNIQPL
jgi:hypothetical protein